MDVLTKNTLRMRPDRIIVGEIRHAEAFSLFTAMNTGHDGCMGTIHANSAHETLVRVVSPPMNVPDLMLAGLNFVIIQHRLHDRYKGTIRRITEIAEVSGVLKGKSSVKTIYKWHAGKDKLMRTKNSIIYLDKIAELTGLSKKQIMKEWQNREKVLKELVKKKVRTMNDVADAMNKYRSQNKK
jgi:flagellar protein FlaI